jgi:hypothetical protein
MYRESEIEVKPAGVQHPCLPRWRDRIAAARNRGHFTDREKMDADNWHTCAIGEALERGLFQRRSLWFAALEHGSAMDHLGLFFSHAVAFDCFDEADLTLDKILSTLLVDYPLPGCA